ncbi:Periplasmic serine protease (ClpP class) [Hahella chejuensis KCTC 2396]|uniref:Periplasmic serine protease (ClpP class) n=1 Tax=Hahella chejuensis (strain KCTC 2396) TaxID=349521 RepID=Q2SK57_HAHCH|nr:S49 family peptidase [Hahella chejuensis]ABC28967.1 Periplasmic serine protease (ClpP class) [Hahella chejuensis KCTC 2396]
MFENSEDKAARESSGRPGDQKEWRLIEKMVMSSLNEQRKARRWGIFFKSLTFLYLFFIVIALSPGVGKNVAARTEPHTAVIEVNGVIAASEEANADAIVSALRDAFEEESAKAVILRINSPGGSPVQAGYVYDEIGRLKGEYPDKKVYAVIMDIGASGAYYIAAAADEIYADKASLVGSIGVTASGFGFVDAMDKLGVERRIFTAGEHKSFLDPFVPVKEDERELWQGVLNTTHKQFIEQVEKGRGDRIHKDNPLLYSGMIWSGEQALGLGLIDGLGSSGFVAREVVKVEKLINYTPKRNPFDELLGKLGVSVGKGVAQAVLGSGPQLQ